MIRECIRLVGGLSHTTRLRKRMLKKSALTLYLAVQFGICHAASESLPPLPTHTMHISVQAPGKPKEDRVVDWRYTIVYQSQLVVFDNPVSVDEASELMAKGTGFKVLRAPTFSTADNMPNMFVDQQVMNIPQRVVSGNTTTLRSVPTPLGISIMVDPVLTDRARPDSVLTRLYLTHTVLPANQTERTPVTASPSAEVQMKKGDRKLLTWSLDGHYYALQLQLAAITENIKK